MSEIVSGRTVSPYPRGGAWHKGLIVLAMLVAPTVANTVLAALINADFSCEALAKDAVQTSATGSGAKLVDIVEIKDGLKTETLVECTGLGLWSDAKRMPIRYKVQKEFGKWYLTFTTAPT